MVAASVAMYVISTIMKQCFNVDNHAWACMVFPLKGFGSATLILNYRLFLMVNQACTYIVVGITYMGFKKLLWMVQHTKLQLLLLLLNLKKITQLTWGFFLYLPVPFPGGLEVDLEGSSIFPIFKLSMQINRLGLFYHV